MHIKIGLGCFQDLFFVSIIKQSRLTLNNNFLAFYDVDSSRKVAE